MRVAITGGTGTLGRALIARLLDEGHDRVVSVSRDEVKAGGLAELFPHPNLRVFLGDVRDRDRLCQAFDGCNTVIHAAALKRVQESSYSPSEVIKTNIQGTINAIWAAKEVGATRCLVISSDKAVHATNLYGATKFTAECYAVQSNSYTYPSGLRVACARYGNVLGSRGSVIEIWKSLPPEAPLPITSGKMTRFVITQQQAVDLVLTSLQAMEGGEIFVPDLPAMSIVDLGMALYPGRNCSFIGLRPGGEKLHEVLISDEEQHRTMYSHSGTLVVVPSFRSWSSEIYRDLYPAYRQWPYSSETAKRLTVEEIRELCQERS